MRPNIVSTIYQKEIIEVLRDRRMLLLVILLPLFLYPVLFTFLGKLGANQADKINAQTVTVVVTPAAEQTPILALLRQDSTLNISVQPTVDRSRIDTMENAIGLLVPEDYTRRIANGEAAVITLLADESEDVLEQRLDRIRAQLGGLGQQIVTQRLARVNLSADYIEPIRIETENLAPQQRMVGRIVGNFLPMMIMFFIFLGCIYIAIDITAGEKERRTLQTVFTAPIKTSEIIAGKFMAVATVGIIAGAVNLLSLVGSVLLQVKLMTEGRTALPGFSFSISGASWLWLIVFVLLLTIFIASLTLAVGLLANSYKEAQSYISPLMMVILIPALASQMPGMELTTSTAMIPILNVSLAMKSVFQDDINVGLIAMVAGFAVLYGFVGLWLAGRSFGNENIVTGEKVNFKSLLRG